MKTLKLIFLIAIVQLTTIQIVNAEIKLPAIVSSNMVLQRNTTISIWGWADAYEEITIKTSWTNELIALNADKDGNWRMEVITTNSKEPQTIKIKSLTSDIILDNVLFGEVWLCSGQSNMGMRVKGNDGQPIFGSNMAIAKSRNPYLRLFTVDRVGSKTPLKNIEKYTSWQEATPELVSDFSAVAYFFGQQLQEILDVPVGLIHTSWGGSKIEAWMSYESLTVYENINLDNVDITKKTNQIPTVLFNAMINPIVSYTIKGVLWYQGESNRLEPDYYKKLFPAMVKDWRTRWGISDFPIYYVQIAPFIYGHENAFETVENSAFMREAQLQCLDLIPNSGIAITMDLGDAYSIHPPKKKQVADRLLFNALNQTYGYKVIDYATPVFESLKVENDGLLLKFKNVEKGLYTFDILEGFEIAGNDRVFYAATAKIRNGRNILVKSDSVPNPVAVRYAWKNWIIGTLFNTSLLPVSSFRTDNWDDAKQVNKL